MISQETKDQIKRAALVEFPERLIGTHTGSVYDQNEHDRAIWKEGATKYTEKLEDKDIELTVWKDTADKFKRLVEEKDKAYNELGVKFDKEVERWQERDANEIEKRRVLESEIERLKYDLDASVKALVETCKKQDRELAQLKEIAERMVKILKTSDIEDEDEELEDVLMTYAEWCK